MCHFRGFPTADHLDHTPQIDIYIFDIKELYIQARPGGVTHLAVGDPAIIPVYTVMNILIPLCEGAHKSPPCCWREQGGECTSIVTPHAKPFASEPRYRFHRRRRRSREREKVSIHCPLPLHRCLERRPPSRQAPWRKLFPVREKERESVY